jgi:hypothetical protein
MKVYGNVRKNLERDNHLAEEFERARKLIQNKTGICNLKQTQVLEFVLKDFIKRYLKEGVSND